MFGLEDNHDQEKLRNLECCRSSIPWINDHPSVCECATTLNKKSLLALSREPVQVKKKTGHDISIWSPLLTRCWAEAAVTEDMAEAVMEDAVMAAEAKAVKAMEP